MNKTIICEALYALPDNIVVKRRKGIALPVIVAVVGVAVLVAVALLPDGTLSSSLASVLAVAGVAAAVGGVAVTMVRLFGKGGVPCLRDSGKPLEASEHSFDKTQLREVLDTVERGDIDALFRMKECSVASVVVVVYRSHDGAFTACQPFEYAELEYRPLRGLKVFEKNR